MSNPHLSTDQGERTMPIQVVMPQFGESVVEATITRWLKAKGESIQEFEPLLEVNTDKVDTEVPSPASGVVLDILIPEGDTVQAGTLLALIGMENEVVGEHPQVGREHSSAVHLQPSDQVIKVERRDRNLGFISPVVARIASEMHVDLSQVKGTGQAGRITKKDILAYVERKGAGSPALLTVPTENAAALQPKLPLSPLLDFTSGTDTVLPHTSVRRAIAERMVFSKHTSPHVSTFMEADMSRVIAHRQATKEAFNSDGVNLTFTAYFVAASVEALQAYPMINSSWSEAGIVLHRSINIGVAASLGDAGLIVPVIKSADTLSLLGLAQAINDLANRARSRQLKPEEVQGGTLTITNHGVSGSLFATPIINPPQSAILGVGAIQKRVVVIGDPNDERSDGNAIAIRPMVYLGLTFDHRILDGAIADHFLGKIVETLQNWGI
jgi:pyruvate/2-oxoglutarate dehydrogenase complex dihydrolipoamide acyltransferase (E2) component